jgi:hypothetical protein
MGDSAGYDLQFVLRSLGLDELGLASADIQLVIPWLPYSYGRVLGALEGTLKASAGRPSSRSERFRLREREVDLLLGSAE